MTMGVVAAQSHVIAISEALGANVSHEASSARESLLSTLRNKVLSKVPENMTAPELSASMTSVKVITDSVLQISNSAADSGLEIVSKLADADLNYYMVQTAAIATSNLFSAATYLYQAQTNGSEYVRASNTSRTVYMSRSSDISHVLRKLSMVIAATQPNYTNSTVIVTKEFELTVHRASTSPFDISAYSSANISVILPVQTNGSADAMLQGVRSLSIIRWKSSGSGSSAGPHSWAGTKLRPANPVAFSASDMKIVIATNVVTVILLDEKLRPLRVKGLADPIRLQLPFGSRQLNATQNQLVYCAYWNESQRKWISDGRGKHQNGTVLCNTSHLTDFAAFLQPPVGNERASVAATLDVPTFIMENAVGFVVVIMLLFVVCVLDWINLRLYGRKHKLHGVRGWLCCAQERNDLNTQAVLQSNYSSSVLANVVVPHNLTVRLYRQTSLRLKWSCAALIWHLAGDPHSRIERLLVMSCQILLSLVSTQRLTLCCACVRADTTIGCARHARCTSIQQVVDQCSCALMTCISAQRLFVQIWAAPYAVFATTQLACRGGALICSIAQRTAHLLCLIS
jgi:hypothetical protein